MSTKDKKEEALKKKGGRPKKTAAEKRLEKMVEDLVKKVDDLQGQIKDAEEKQQKSKERDEDLEISPTEYIEVMSLIPRRLSLSTEGKGKGRVYTFDGLYETQKILYSRLVDIIRNQRSFLKKGLFYILDPRVVRVHGYDSVYDEILDKERIETVINEGYDVAFPIFKGANKEQQKNIAGIIITKLTNGEVVDQNLVRAIEAETKIDISEKVEDRKAMLKLSK